MITSGVKYARGTPFIPRSSTSAMLQGDIVWRHGTVLKNMEHSDAF